MIPARYLPLVQTFLLALVMTAIMSFAITLINLGWAAGFAGLWLQAWGAAFAIAFPTLLLIAPLVRRLAVRIASGAG